MEDDTPPFIMTPHSVPTFQHYQDFDALNLDPFVSFFLAEYDVFGHISLG